LVANYYDNLCA